MNDFTAHNSSDTNNAQFLAPETHQRAEGEGDYRGFTATYSPEDNKLRLYASSRLDKDTYTRVRAAGFIWAAKQEVFVAPMWTPGRADFLVELCGDIGDEDTSLVDRAEERADRFADYRDNRLADAHAAHRAVESVSQRFEAGQPILVGHHSERKARKDAERMENGMRKAVKMWDTAQYWKARAAGALRHARYKERADVRARRIKGIEADKRKQERTRAEAVKWQELWATEGLALEQARAIAGQCWLTVIRDESGAGGWTAYDVLRPDGERYSACPAWTVDQVQAAAAKAYLRTIEWCDRWIAHYENRLTYERAMLEEQGGIAATKTGPEKGGRGQVLGVAARRLVLHQEGEQGLDHG
jgi:hypothetical protein